MHHSISSRKKKFITASMAGLLTVAIVGGTIYSDSTTAMARPSLPGIEAIVNANSKEQPFKILEIVDDYPSARIGFTVAGEEPADKYTADAISDMAYETERIGDSTVPVEGRFMNSVTGHTTETTNAYVELKDKAFTYSAYTEDKAYEGDADAKVGYSYGHFEESTTPGRYKETLSTDVYAQVSVDGGADGNLTIEQVYQRNDASDQTGIFYADYVGISKVDDITESTNELVFELLESDNAWKTPFNSHTTSTGDKYYTKQLFVLDKEFKHFDNDHETPADTDDDTIDVLGTVEEGDAIFELAAGDKTLSYFGYIAKNSADELKFFDKAGVEYDIESTYSGGAFTDSFAKMIEDSGTLEISRFFTVREEGDSDAALDKYFVKDSPANTYGMYKLTFYNKQQVNDPAFQPAMYGIEDESDASKGPWYHTWFYKMNAKEPYTYVETSGTHDFIHNYANDAVSKYYYKGGFVNNEWFKTQVLDIDLAECGSKYVDVVTKKMCDVTADDIYSSNLIYFTGGDYGTTEDMKEETAVAIIKDIDTNNKAVILNLSSFYTKVYGDPTAYPNANLLMRLLMQQNIDGIGNYIDTTDPSKLATVTTVAETHLKNVADTYKASIDSRDLSHVLKTVFIQDDINGVALDDAINADFNRAYSDAKVQGFKLGEWDFDGFKDIQVDIDEELFYLGVAGKDTNSFNDAISKATSIRYILNFGNRRAVAKTAIRVLDIEPYYNRALEKSKNTSSLTRIKAKVNGAMQTVYIRDISNVRDIFTEEWYRKNISDSTAEIEITGMGTKEFIGKIDDLNESYDLIYIGMDTAYLNTEIKNVAKQNNNYMADKTTNVVGNTVGTYVYRHIGDTIQTSGIHGTDAQYAMGGNDITPDKLRELKMYVQAGYAVLLSDEFFEYDNTGRISKISSRIDPDSNMYKFVEWCQDRIGKNVDITKNFESADDGTKINTTDHEAPLTHKETFVKYLNISKLDVEVLEQPPLYNTYDGDTEHYYIPMNSQGLYTLDYKVRLTNDAATDTTKTTYDCQLYIDHDGDGRYEAVEALDSLEITNIDTGNRLDPNAEQKYSLTTGSTYTISRKVPEGYVGIIPWKLVFVENNRDTDLIKVSVQDYAAISDLTNKPTIRILQLTSGDGTATNLDLKDDPTLKEYYKQIKDFSINVTKDTVGNYINNNGTGNIFKGGDRLETLYQYDMLVLGFIDMYRLPDNNKTEEAVLALREYILSGRSVLFTHDLTSTVTTASHGDKSWGYLANTLLRDVQGMDRYGAVKNYLSGKKYNNRDLTEYKSAYDYKIPSNGDMWGFCDPTLLRYNSGNSYGEIAAEDTRLLAGGERELTSVARLNRGQVTEYPFRIGALEQNTVDSKYYAKETIEVAKTHHQYFQLNMETDYTDENYDDDIVVWYTISTDNTSKYYHRLNFNDARNNYYIFNKGNITYTGAGHSKIDDNTNSGNAEKKLFVNTLVAAYNAGTHAPYASYKSDETQGARDISSMYVPYDLLAGETVENGGEGNGLLEDTITVYFKTVNNNLQDNKKPLVAEYFVVNKNGSYVKDDANNKVNSITPVSIYDCTTKETKTAADLLANGHVYKLEFAIKGANGLLQGDDIVERYDAVLCTSIRAAEKENPLPEDINKIRAAMRGNGLPASDSFTKMKINIVQLYNLE